MGEEVLLLCGHEGSTVEREEGKKERAMQEVGEKQGHEATGHS